MHKPFDSSTKELFENWPGVCFRLTGWEWSGILEVINADVTTVAAEADKVIKVRGEVEWLIHLELQSGPDPWLPARLYRYNALLYHRHRRPVASVVVLLRPEADGPELADGRLAFQEPGVPGHFTFPFKVVRLWEIPSEALMDGELGLLALAILADHPRESAPALVQRIDERIRNEAAPGEAATLWNIIWLLLGVKYSSEVTEALLRGIPMIDLRDSSTYMAAVREGMAKGLEQGQGLGRLQEAREFLLRMGRKRFGEPDPETMARILAINDRERIERIGERILDATGWAEAMDAS